MKTFISISFILAFTLFGCEKKDTNNKDAISATFPFLKEGNEWHFWYTTSENTQGSELIYRILTIGDNGYIEVENEFVDLLTDIIYWYADNNMFSEIASPDDNYKLPLLKVNPVLNESWSSTVNDEGNEYTIARKIISLNDSVQLPGMTYIKNCIIVHETMSGYSQYYKDIWVSKDAGIVRIEGKGYYEEDGSSPVYFNLAYVLISKSF